MIEKDFNINNIISSSIMRDLVEYKLDNSRTEELSDNYFSDIKIDENHTKDIFHRLYPSSSGNKSRFSVL